MRSPSHAFVPGLVALSLALIGCVGDDPQSSEAGSGSSPGSSSGASSGSSGGPTTSSTSTGESESGESESGETDSPPTYTIGGAVQGLVGAGLRLGNIDGQTLEIAADGPFTFELAVMDSEDYGVSIEVGPQVPDQICTVSAASGTLAGSDVQDVLVRCQTPIRHVLVIGIDGLGGAYLGDIETPVLDALAADSVATMAMQNALPTMSAPNWMSMIAGSSPDQHGVLSNGWSPGDSQPTPTFFAVVREQLPGAKIGIFHDWGAFEELVEPGVATHIESPGDEHETMVAALAWMKAERPELLFVHLDHVDHAGHLHGWGGDDYVDAVEFADVLVGDALAALEVAGMLPYTAILVSADHGGDGLSHGDDTSLERPIPLIFRAPQVSETAVTRELRIFDIAPTVVALFGLQAPSSWIGRPIVEGLVGAELPLGPQASADVVAVMEYEWRYDDKGSGALADVSIWRPLPPPGYVALGDVVVGGHSPPVSSALVVRDEPGTTARPLGYERIWDDRGSFGDHDVAIWSPIAPLGFVCLGDVAAQLYDSEPSPEIMRCLHRDRLLWGVRAQTWSDEGSGAWEDLGLWTCGAGERGGSAANTFIARRHHDDPGYPKCWVIAD